MKHFSKYFLVFLIFMTGCNSGEPTRIDIGQDYFPLLSGQYQVYTVEQTNYSEVKPAESLSFQLKVEVTDSFPSPEGGYIYVLARSKRSDANADWTSLDTWSVRKTDRELIVNEENTSYLKLIFPVRKGVSWDGNLYNILGRDDYAVDALDVPFTTEGGMTFDKSLTVTQENNDDIIVFQDIRAEVYARGVGLISRTITQLNYCSTENCVGQQIIKSGMRYKQTILEYGRK